MKVENSNIQKTYNQSRQFEHEYLRAEIETNKKLVFERALLIAGAALAATLLPKEAKGIELLGIPVMGALAFNLWFTVNRLASNARIIAYLQIFHESRTAFPWVGWETSLRLYRIWRNTCPNEIAEVKSEFSKISQYDDVSFYKPIFVLHIAMSIAIAVLMSVRALVTLPLSSSIIHMPAFLLPSVNGVTVLLFIIWAVRVYHPMKLQYGIERNLILWRGVFNSYRNGQLRGYIGNECEPNE